MKMKQIIWFSLLMVLGFASFAQDYPYHYFTHINQVVYNPSLVSAEDKISADVMTYQLWAGGFKPLSDYSLSISFSPGLMKRSRSNYYQAHYGLGATVLRDKIGPFNHNILQLIYAYHLPVADRVVLSFGINLLAENLAIDVHSLNPMQNEDPRLLTGKNQSMLFDGGFGTSLRGDKFRVSFSVQNLAPGTFYFNESTAGEFKSYRKFYLTGLYRFDLHNGMYIQPNVTIRNNIYEEAAFDLFIDCNLRLCSFGAGYRSEQTVFLFAAFPFNDFIFTYTSENPVKFNHMIGNGHTFSLGWKIR